MDSELVMSLCVHDCVFLPLFKGECGKSLAKGMITLLESQSIQIQAHTVTQSLYSPPVTLFKSDFSLCEYFNIIPLSIFGIYVYIVYFIHDLKRSQKIDICNDDSFLMDWSFYNDELCL